MIVPDPSQYEFPTPTELRQMRVAHGYTLKEAANGISVDPETVRRREKNITSPQLHNVRELVQLYKGRGEASD